MRLSQNPESSWFFFNLGWWTRLAEAGLSDPTVRTLMFYSRKIIPNSGNEFSRLLGCAPALDLQFQERFVTTRLHRLKEKRKAFLFRKDGATHEILMAARSVFIPLTAPEYQLLALGRAPEGPISPSPDLQIRLAAQINRSATKCAVTNAESGGRKQI